MKNMRMLSLLGIVLLLAPAAAIANAASPPPDRIRHELIMLPYFSVFDNLNFQIQGDTVVLGGQVVRPVLKSDAENAVKNVEGVGQVVNNIEVLPLSPMDDGIRRATLRAVYGAPQLNRYALGSNPPIHIIVKNGNVTLEGVVDSPSDSQVAYMRASSVPNVFSVTNNLRVGS